MSWFLRVGKDTQEPQRRQLKQKRTNRPINNTGPGALRVPFLKGGVRARHASGGSGGGCRRRGRVIGVRNNDGRAEEAAEIGIGRTFARKKAQGQLPRPLMAGAGLGGQRNGAGSG